MAYQYIAKATLAEDVETYVKREADDELYHALVQGEICNVFNSRKAGKSSLAVRTIKRLRKANIQSVVIDFSLNDTQLANPDQWYASMLDPLAFELNLDVNLKTWHEERNWLTPLRRFQQFIETILLTQISDFIVVFLDEIDSVLSLNLPTDDFFAFIRGCYNLRATKPEYKRLTFCLLGVVTVSDLIKDKRRTPFNIGQAIELKGFTLEEATPVLTTGLEGKFGNNSTAILEQIIKLTGGQPFLTQKLCQRVLEYAEIDYPNIDEIAHTYIIDNWEAQDNPELLRTIRNRLISEQVQNRSGRLLSIYQEILTCGRISADSNGDQMELQLTGLVVKENEHLKVYNPIYKEVFNLNWVQQELAKLRPYQENFDAWIESAKKDDSRLLRGEALDEALKWKEGKRLSDDDTAFLDASQRYERDDLRQAKAKAKEIIKTAQEGTKIEIAGIQALRLFNPHTEFEALRDAKNAGEDLQKLLKKWENLVKDDSELAAESPATSPLLALQKILSKIQAPQTFMGHNDRVTSVSFSPDGKYLATGSDDKTVKVWSIETKTEFHTFTGHTNRVTSVSFSPNGKYLATGSDDKTVKVWSIETKTEFHTFTGHTNRVTSVSFSPDGKYLATGSWDKTVKVWSLKLKQKPRTFTNHTNWVTSVSFSPDGKYLATGSKDKTVKVWSLKSSIKLKAKPRTFTGHTDSVWSVSFSPDSKYLATGSDDKTVKVWSIETKTELHTFTINTYYVGVTSVSFSSDGKYLAIGSDGVQLWSMETKAKLRNFRVEDRWGIEVSFSPDGKYLATNSGYDINSALLWLIKVKDELQTFIGHTNRVRSVSFSPDGKYLATGSEDKTAKLWSMETKAELHTFTDYTNQVTSVSFSSDGKYLATGSGDNTAKLWSIETKAELHTFTGHTDYYYTEPIFNGGFFYMGAGTFPLFNFLPDVDSIISCEASPEEILIPENTNFDSVLSINNKGEVFPIETKTLPSVRRITSVTSVSFSPDGKYLATGSEDKTAKLWSMETKAELHTFTGHTTSVWSVSFSPDSKYLAICSDTVKLWSIETKAQLHTLTDTGSHILPTIVSFSPDGKYLATCSADNTAKLWSLETKEELHTFIGHTSRVTSMSFSRDGKYLATGSWDNTAKLWDLSGNLIADFIGYQDGGQFIEIKSSVLSVCFSPDGKYLAAGYADGVVRLWPIENLNQLLARARKWLQID